MYAHNKSCNLDCEFKNTEWSLTFTMTSEKCL